VDIMAARDAGVMSVAVFSGMGLKKDLEKAKPDYLFENILEMAKRI
jgi:phosphoglycolate phosphatase-like HAD superfamily hydrolase